MAPTRKILLLGGHGRVALHLTPLLLAGSWHVTSLIRNEAHKPELESLAAPHPGTLSIELSDESVSASSASSILSRVAPDTVIWTAGAGGKGGAERTFAVDRDAAKAWIKAACADKGVRRFLMVSYIGSRRNAPPWWTAEDKKAADHVNQEVLANYYKAKVDADECLLAAAEKRRKEDPGFQMINLRPGTLKDGEGTGKVRMGKTPSRGDVQRADVAAVAAALVAREDANGYFDLLQGDKGIEEEIDRLIKEGHDGTEGEDLQEIYSRI